MSIQMGTQLRSHEYRSSKAILAGKAMQRTEGKHHFTSVDRALLTDLVAVSPERLAGEAGATGPATCIFVTQVSPGQNSSRPWLALRRTMPTRILRWASSRQGSSD